MGIPNIPKLDFASVAGISGNKPLVSSSFGGNSLFGSNANAGMSSPLGSMNSGGTNSGMMNFGLPGMASPANSGMGGFNMGSLGLPGDVMGMMTMITSMMIPIMMSITSVLMGILNGSISSKAPEGQTGDGSTASGDPSQIGGDGNSTGSTPTGNVAPGAQGALATAAALKGKGGGDAAIDAITKKSGLNSGSQPWCAAFAMNILKDAGVLDTTGLSNMNYTPTIYQWAKKNGIWGAKGSYVPKPGDAVEFDWGGGDPNSIDHIGIVKSVKTDANGKVISITTIEGNSSNSVKENTYTDMSDIAGYVISGKAHPGHKV